MVGAFEQALLAAMIFVIMLGMGASIRRSDLRAALVARRAFVTGMICQFGLMPLIALGLAYMAGLPAPAALALIMIGATPGGTTSNLFTFWSRGDVALSVAMTVASTLAAVVMMPLLIGLYAGSNLTGDVAIPYANIAVTLALVLIPCAIGVGVRAGSARAAAAMERTGSLAGMALIAILIANFIIGNSALVLATPASLIAACVLLSVIGFILGRGLAGLAGLNTAQARTVSLETGIQNTPLTIAVIGLSFAAGPMQEEMLLVCALYAVSVVITSAMATGVFRIRVAQTA